MDGRSPRPLAWAKEAALAAGAAFVLALPLAGFRLPDGAASSLVFRPWWVAVAVIAVAAGRFVLAMNRDLAMTSGAGASLFLFWGELKSTLAPYTRLGVIAVLVAMVLLPLLPFGMRRVLDLTTLVLIYVMLAAGLNIVVGLAGLLDLGYVAFYAVGAYAYALLSTQFGWSFWMCLPIAGALSALAGIGPDVEGSAE